MYATATPTIARCEDLSRNPIPAQVPMTPLLTQRKRYKNTESRPTAAFSQNQAKDRRNDGKDHCHRHQEDHTTNTLRSSQRQVRTGRWDQHLRTAENLQHDVDVLSHPNRQALIMQKNHELR